MLSILTGIAEIPVWQILSTNSEQTVNARNEHK